MGCGNLIISDIEVLCENNSGGVAEEILVTDWCNLIQAGLLETVEGIYDAIQIEVGEKFWQMNVLRLSAELKEDDLSNFDTGSTGFKQILDVIIPRKDVARRNSIRTMGAGQKKLAFAVLDGNGIWWGCGFREGVQLMTRPSGTGKKKEDLNGYTISFQGDASIEMSTIDPALIAGLQIPAV